MIYDFPESSSPIAQGDIFFGIPILDLPDDELSIVDDASNVRTLPWETFASEGEPVSAIIAVRPTIAIVGTQECDALRAPNITLFEVRPFRDVERKSKDTSKPSKWVPLITQHARINQKWFYLPADERVGFGEKMGADFLTPIRLPRLTLERLLGFRKGRLNEVAKQHFRERLAEFFRRYAYDEWYPLTREELAEYQKTHPEAEPFPWQSKNRVSGKEVDTKGAVEEINADDSEMGLLDFLLEGEKVVEDLAGILTRIANERQNVAANFEQYKSQISQLGRDTEAEVGDYQRVASLIASDRNTFSKYIEDVLPKFAKVSQTFIAGFSALVSLMSLVGAENIERVRNLRNSFSQFPDSFRLILESLIEARDEALRLRNENVSKELNNATSRQAQALDSIIPHVERLESFALNLGFLFQENFREPPTSEGKAE